MTFYAQTNVQLFNQLVSGGYPKGDLLRIERGYGLAARLFRSTLRSSGKPFLCHLVGTASILASLKLSLSVVAAGLLHAAYGMTKVKPSEMRRVLGRKADDLVRRYTDVPWDRYSVPIIHASVGRLPAVYQEVVLIRLANELEDCWDGGILYGSQREKKRRSILSYLYRAADMARGLGYPQLASALGAGFRRVSC